MIFVEDLHHAVCEEMVVRAAIIVLDDRPVAIDLLLGAEHGLAAGEDEPGKLVAQGGLEHVDHAEHVDADPKRHVRLDLGAHEIGEVNAMREVAMAGEDGFDGGRVGDVHRLDFARP